MVDYVNPVVWKETMALGHAAIDAQHQQIIRLFNNFVVTLSIEALNKDIRNAFSSIALYTDVHCNLEEQLMRDIGYPDRRLHIIGHIRLKDEIHKTVIALRKWSPDVPSLVKLATTWREALPVSEDDCKLIEYWKRNRKL